MKSRLALNTVILAIVAACGHMAAASQGFAGRSCANQRDEMTCMVCAIYFEAGNQSYNGKVQVGKTIETRKAAEDYPRTVCGNVYESKQFSFNKNRRLRNNRALTDSVKAAVAALSSGPNGATHYHATYIRKPRWAYRCNRVSVIGQHIFYRCPGVITDREIAQAQAEAEARARAHSTQLASRDSRSKVVRVVAEVEGKVSNRVASKPAAVPANRPAHADRGRGITQQAAIDDIVMGDGEASR